MKYWLFKSEPDEYSIDDLAGEPSATGRWDGIRNYQARNLLRDQVAVGDQLFFYHSSCRVPGVVGTARVVKAAYPDPAQFTEDSPYFDARSSTDTPRWYCVDIKFTEKFPHVVSMKAMKTHSELQNMVLFRQGRLSIQPVSKAEWEFIVALGRG